MILRIAVLAALVWTGMAQAAERGTRPAASRPGIGEAASNTGRLLPSPRLSVDGFAYGPAPAQAGMGLNMDIKVRNTGDADSEPDAYELWLDCRNLVAGGTDCPFGKHSVSLPAIPKGQTRSVVLATMPWSAGKFRISGWVKPAGDTGPLRGRPWSTTIQVQGGTIPIPEGDKLPSVSPTETERDESVRGGFRSRAQMQQAEAQTALTAQTLRAHLIDKGLFAPAPLQDDLLLACSVVGPSEFPHARITNDTDIAIPAGTEVRYAVGSLDNVFPMQLDQLLAPGQHVDGASFEAGMAYNPYSDGYICAAIAWAAD